MVSAVTQAHTSQCGLNGELRVETLGSRGQCSGTLSDYNSATCQFESYLTLQLTGELLLLACCTVLRLLTSYQVVAWQQFHHHNL